METAIQGGAASAEVEARLAPVAEALGAIVAALRLALPPEIEAAPAVSQAVDPRALSSPPRGRAPHNRPRGGRMNFRGQKLVALPAVHRAPGADV